jgi:hypothetical protein
MASKPIRFWFQLRAEFLQLFAGRVEASFLTTADFHEYVKNHPKKFTKEAVEILLSEFEAYFGSKGFLLKFKHGGGYAIVPWESIGNIDHSLVFEEDGRYSAINFVTGTRYVVHSNRADVYLCPDAMEAARQQAAPAPARVQCGTPRCALPAYHTGLCTGEHKA